MAGKHAEMHDLIAAQIEPFAEARLLEEGAREIAIHAIDNRTELKNERADEETSPREKPGRGEADQDGNDRNLIRRNRRAHKELRKQPAKRAIEKAIDQAVRTAGQ